MAKKAKKHLVLRSQRQAAFEMYEDPMSLFSGFYLVEEEQAAQEVPSGLDCFSQGK